MLQIPPIARAVRDCWIVLIGGGEFSFGETHEIDQFLVRQIPPGNRTIAFLPTASGSSEYAIHLGKYFKTFDPELQLVNVPVYRGRDARRGKNLDLIRNAGMIYIGGGVTNVLLDTLRQSPAEEAMRTAAVGGAVIAGIGAGAAALGSWARDVHRPGGAVPGLNWVLDAAIEPGFRREDDTELRRLMAIPEVKLGIGIPARTALALGPQDVGEIVGAGAVALVRKSETRSS